MKVFYRKSHSKFVKENELSEIIKEFGLSWSEDDLKNMLEKTGFKPIVNVWDKNGKPLFMTVYKENILYI